MAERTFNFGKPAVEIETPLISVEAARALHAANPAEVIYTGPSPYGWHEVGLFKRCPQLYEHTISGRLPEDDGAHYLTRGSLVHTGLASYYARKGAKQKAGVMVNGTLSREPKQWHEPLVAVALVAGMLHDQGDKHALPKLALAQKITQAYLTFMAGTSLDYGIKILAVEQVTEIRCQPGNHPYTARMDLVIESSDSMYQVWDHKILARVDRARAQYSYSGQIHGHRAIGYQLWGPKFGGSRLNVLSADPEDFSVERVMPLAAPALADRLPESVAEARNQIALYRTKYPPGRWPVTFACTDSQGRRCPAWGLCSGVGR